MCGCIQGERSGGLTLGSYEFSGTYPVYGTTNLHFASIAVDTGLSFALFIDELLEISASFSRADRLKERDRAIAEAQALLETARREKEEEAKKAEASAKAKEAERAREQAEVDRKAEEKRQEVRVWSSDACAMCSTVLNFDRTILNERHVNKRTLQWTSTFF